LTFRTNKWYISCILINTTHGERTVLRVDFHINLRATNPRGNLRCYVRSHVKGIRAADRKSNLPSFQMFRNINAGAPHNFIPIAIHHRLSIEIRSQTECARGTSAEQKKKKEEVGSRGRKKEKRRTRQEDLSLSASPFSFILCIAPWKSKYRRGKTNPYFGIYPRWTFVPVNF